MRFFKTNAFKGLPVSDRIQVDKTVKMGRFKNLQVDDDAELFIGKSVVFREFINILVEKNSTLKIDDNVFFNNCCSINCLDSIKIGENTLFGEGVKIYDHNHSYTLRPFQIDRGGFTTAPIVIGENCWIGSNVTILKGVTIGKNVIIGANCLVVKSIPSGCIVKHTESLNITAF